VTVTASSEAISAYWEGDGKIVGEGPRVRWTPEADSDQIRVAVRARRGVAVAAMRALAARPYLMMHLPRNGVALAPACHPDGLICASQAGD
jgi:hypothetical protein